MEVKRKKCKVIMLPTNKAQDCILISEYGNVRGYHKGYFTKDYLRNIKKKAFHIYITSNDEIKEGDYYIYGGNRLAIGKVHNKSHLPACLNIVKTPRKIIATTDKSLVFSNYKGVGREKDFIINLPQPSQAFIEKYCKLGGIDEVLVEYEKDYYASRMLSETEDSSKWNWIYKLKVYSHNIITIHPIKDSWNREEIEKLLFTALFEPTPYNEQEANNWIKENL